MENFIIPPVLVERHCGGWLAISGADEPIKVGVVAETEAGAAALYETTIRTWRRNLDVERRGMAN